MVMVMTTAGLVGLRFNRALVESIGPLLSQSGPGILGPPIGPYWDSTISFFKGKEIFGKLRCRTVHSSTV